MPTLNSIHLKILADRLSLAESTHDVEGQCLVFDAITSFIAPLKRTAKEQALIACDQRTKEQTVAFEKRGRGRG